MKHIDLYIYLPNSCNTSYNKCFHLSTQPINQEQFFCRLQLLYKTIKCLDIGNIYYIGGQPTLNKHMIDMLQIFSQYNQIILTNGIKLFDKLDSYIRYVKYIDICRLSIEQKRNKLLLKNNNALDVLQIQKITQKCKNKKIKTRIVVPVSRYFDQNIETFVSMSKYLYSDIVFRQLSFDSDNRNSVYQYFENYPTICFNDGKSYDYVVKRFNDTNVWIQNIYSNINQNNDDYIVYHPNGTLSNNFRK